MRTNLVGSSGIFGLALVGGVVMLPVAAAIASSAAELPALAGRDVELAFSEGQPVGHVFPAGAALTNTGTTGIGVSATVLYASGGTLKVAAGRGSGNLAVALPAHIASPTGTPKSAVIKIVNTGAADLLDPGTADFSFGADFALNTASSTPDSKDNGDNLIQRGLSNSATQYKIQIDAGKPSCVVKQLSTGTTIIAKTTQAVVRSTWYRAVCQRTTSGGQTTLTLTVTRLSNGAVLPATTGTGAAVDLSIATGVPLSVGGKLGDTGNVILSATDQFNGRVDNAFLDLP